MTVLYEEAARKQHPGANTFYPVKGIVFGLYGWIFKTNKVNLQADTEWAWVTVDGTVSTDPVKGNQGADICRRNLKTFVKSQGPHRGANISVRNTGSAIATDGGDAVTGISIRKAEH